MISYKEDLVKRYWAYQQIFFNPVEEYFERPYASDNRPPVFLKHQAKHNVITNHDASNEEIKQLLNLVPPRKQHKWFRSMNSSLALAQSVFGNLAIYHHLNHLTELNDDEGEPLLGKAQVSEENFAMEHKVNHFGEPNSTSLDCLISGTYQVAIECKFTEGEVGLVHALH